MDPAKGLHKIEQDLARPWNARTHEDCITRWSRIMTLEIQVYLSKVAAFQDYLERGEYDD